MSPEQIIQRAAGLMESMAADPSHGYDQLYRWGEKGDYDCSSAVITAFEQAGVPVKSRGATYTGNMAAVFLDCGFEDVTKTVSLSGGAGLQRGDVLLNHKHHTALYLGNGKTAEASINELDTVSGGHPGDQTGREFLVRAYRNYPWDMVLRYVGSGEKEESAPAPGKLVDVKLPQIKMGDMGPGVAMMQGALKYHGCDPKWVDGDFGTRSHNMLMAFQAEQGLEPDGICGRESWAALGGEKA